MGIITTYQCDICKSKDPEKSNFESINIIIPDENAPAFSYKREYVCLRCRDHIATELRSVKFSRGVN